MKPRPPSKKRKLNVRLLRKIQRHILEEPRRFAMSWFSIHADNQKEWSYKRDGDISKIMPPCGTAACIAGWANILTDSDRYQESSVSRARDVLGLDSGNEWDLFDELSWPQPYNKQYEKAKTPKQRAKIACARIDHLIKTGE